MFEHEATVVESYSQEALYRLNVGFTLGQDLVHQALREVLRMSEPHKRDVYLAILLNGLMARGASEEEITGLLTAAFEVDGFEPTACPRFQVEGKKTVVVAGSGKKGFKTFNISTFACFVAACDDVVILKPCARSTSSKTGSADLADLLGIQPLAEDRICETAKRLNIGLFSIEQLIPRFDGLYGGRFFAPHALSFALAGLTVPVRADKLLYGLAHPNLPLALKVFRAFQVPSALVVTSTYDGIHYVDETLPFGVSYFQGYREGATIGRLVNVETHRELGLPSYDRRAIAQESDPKANVLKGLRALMGLGDLAACDTLCLGAANILYLAGRTATLRDGYERACEIVRAGEPLDRLFEYIRNTGGDTAVLSTLLRELSDARSCA